MTDIGKVGHYSILIVGWQVVVAGDRGNWVEGGKVVPTILIVGCCSRDIWVVSFRDLARIRSGLSRLRTWPKSWM